MRHYTVPPSDSGYRLDRFLSLQEPNLTRSFLQKLIRDGNVFVNHKKTVKSGHPLSGGDELTVLVPSLKETGIQSEDIPLDIVYEDADMVVVNKPAGMVTHPTDHGAHVSGTLVNALLHHCRDLSGIGGERRPGIVHRLDKDTSGLIMVAKNDAAHHALSKQIQARTVIKEYVTLLKGHPVPAEGSIEAPILKAGGGADMRVSRHHKAKYALTHYRTERAFKDTALVAVRIVTGRTHQIRVHFSAVGHPVAGDAMYGDATFNTRLAEKTGLRRQFLHARSLTFVHPRTGKTLTLTAPLPADLEQTIERL